VKADDKRRLENQLMTMGLPSLDDPDLVQVLADSVNGYPIMSERVEFFCELLNQCDAWKRTEMYEAMRPRLSFDVPSLAECETRIVAKAERMVDRRLSQPAAKAAEPDARILHLECFGCKKSAPFVELTIAGCMAEAHKAGWGRGPEPGHEYCAECRLAAFNASIGGMFTRRVEGGLDA
jgi:hypothetical protein